GARRGLDSAGVAASRKGNGRDRQPVGTWRQGRGNCSGDPGRTREPRGWWTAMSRLASAFAAQATTRLVTYVTAGDPDLARSREILLALDRAGADVIEVGVPFSD